MNRRNFLRSLLIFLGSTALVSFAYPLLRFLEPPGAGAKAVKVIIKKGDIPPGAARDIVINSAPAIVINIPDKGFIALSKVCTHLGCLVDYDSTKKRLVCPCHAGVFSLEGKVLSGPPPKPLLKYAVKVQGEDIVIG
ncbi:MAG: Rieske (2Fe-2S) protein [Nitrospirae bacterium]|nr:Rieske (2Fe-2S) protein [Nitrospirota bacterium]